MPTVDQRQGFEFRMYHNDHAPAHVHIFKAGGMVKIEIGDGANAVKVIGHRNMKPPEIRRAVRIVETNWQVYFDAWEHLHA
jgi:hypothetical protein